MKKIKIKEKIRICLNCTNELKKSQKKFCCNECKHKYTKDHQLGWYQN